MALVLSVITTVYNVAEGIVFLIFGINDRILALLGFGVDSFVEVISGIGILHMIVWIKKSSEENRDNFESAALRITGFYVITAGLITGSIINIIEKTFHQRHRQVL